MSNPQLLAARNYVLAGLSVIPCKLDGSKSPAFGGWRTYSKRRPTDAEVHGWFGRPDAHGIGVVGGYGNLAVLDFEAAAAFDQWYEILSPEARELVAASPVVSTGGGGRHAWVRCGFNPPPGTVLARTADKSVLIEIRGSSHFVVAPGSPARVHRSGVPYVFAQTGWLEPAAPPAVWDEAAFAAAVAAAKAANEFVPTERVFGADTGRPAEPAIAGSRPGDDFNRRASWDALLRPAGWRVVGRDDSRTLWLRPKKRAGISATTGYCRSEVGGDLFYCFSSNAEPFSPDRAYDKFGAFALLHHHGDLRAAARVLAANGYGADRPKVTATVTVGRKAVTS